MARLTFICSFCPQREPSRRDAGGAARLYSRAEIVRGHHVSGFERPRIGQQRRAPVRPRAARVHACSPRCCSARRPRTRRRRTTARSPRQRAPTPGLGADIKAYVTAPLHAGSKQWIAFGALVGGIAVAHHYDEDVRNHIGPGPAVPAAKPDTHDDSDALPAALMVGGTWAAGVMFENRTRATRLARCSRPRRSARSRAMRSRRSRVASGRT